MSKLTPMPHNDFFYTVMSRKENAITFFSRHLPPEKKQILDLSKIELCESKSISDEFKTRFSDALYRCPTKTGQIAYLYALCEHQSEPHAHMPLRVLEYKVAGIKYHLNQGHKDYPIFINFVVYTGMKKWKHSPRLGDYYKDRALGEQSLYMEPFILVKLIEKPVGQIYKDKALGFFSFAFLAARQKDAFQSFEQAMENPFFKDYFSALNEDIKMIFINYLSHFVDQQKHSLKKLVSLSSTNPQEKQKIMTSIAAAFQQEGIKIGRQMGEKKGMEIGHQLGFQMGEKKGMETGKQKTLEELINKGYLTKQEAEKILKDDK